MKPIREALMAGTMLAAGPITLSVPATAQEFPLVATDYTTMTGVFIQDGGTLAYAKYIAGEWARNQEFAKSKGWISDYKIYFNVNARDGEPSVYLTETHSSVPGGAESERRDREYEAWSKKSETQRNAEAGDRAKFRTLRGSLMLQEYIIRK